MTLFSNDQEIRDDAGNVLPVSAASLPLPTGASTVAKQPALGTAGSASADVITVQGVASMTALKTDSSATTQPVSGTVTANAGSGTMAVSAAALPLPSGAATSTLQTQPGVDIGDVTINNSTGAAAVNIQDGGNSITVDGTVTANAGTGTMAVSAAALPLPSGAATLAKQPALGTAGTASTDVLSVQGIASMTALKTDGSATTQPVSGTVTANAGTGSFTVAQATGSNLHTVLDSGTLTTLTTLTGTTSLTPGVAAANLGKAEDAVHASGDTGVMALGVRDDTLSVNSGTEGDYEPFHTTADGAVWVTAIPSTTGGWSPSFNAVVTTTVKTVKASSGTLGGWFLYNPNASVAYVQVFDTAGAVTLGTTVPVISLGIPPGAGANVENANGIQFINAIKFACTTTSTGLTAPSSGLECNFWFK